MIIDEKKLSELSHSWRQTLIPRLYGKKTCMEFFDTLEALWKVARAAEALLNAGSPSGPNAKKLVDALKGLK